MGDTAIPRQTTFEEAKTCPKCQKVGQDAKTEPLLDGKGTTLHHIYCRTDGCDWENTPWLVQVNADGSIPPPTDHTKSIKEYRGFEFHDDEAKAVIANLQRVQEISTDPSRHGEIRGR
jgi:hypothetical protein